MLSLCTKRPKRNRRPPGKTPSGPRPWRRGFRPKRGFRRTMPGRCSTSARQAPIRTARSPDPSARWRRAISDSAALPRAPRSHRWSGSAPPRSFSPNSFPRGHGWSICWRRRASRNALHRCIRTASPMRHLSRAGCGVTSRPKCSASRCSIYRVHPCRRSPAR